jgi:hypothetical protein
MIGRHAIISALTTLMPRLHATIIFGLCAALHVHAADAIDVARVWAGHPVGFALLTQGDRQFVAFYDADRTMTVGQRRLDGTAWQFQKLPEKIGWDSHNYVTIAIDDTGNIHLAGNMHVKPLVYFRTETPLDITTMKRIPAMIGRDEGRMTYPKFLRGPNREFLFTYRDGSSGNGVQIFNGYNAETKTWSRFLDKPLFDGEGKCNAYFDGPKPGPDGYFHVAWVWRDTPDCSTNHTVSYARSKDLKQWESASGEAIPLPIRLDSPVTVDPVPAHGGVVNTSIGVGFDLEKHAVVSYHKFDAAGNTQAYNARWEDGAWRIHQSSNWSYRWDPSGGGSIQVEVSVGTVRVDAAGRLLQPFSHKIAGSGQWVLENKTLTPISQVPNESRVPPELRKVESTFPSMRPRFRFEQDALENDIGDYFLRWETLGPNRDKPREGDLPPPSMLRLYEIGGQIDHAGDQRKQ